MTERNVGFTSLGLVVLDEIRFPDREPLTDVLGGSGVYSTLGARLFLPSPESASIGWTIRVGDDFPKSIEEELMSWNATLTIKRERGEPSTRGLLEYQDTTFGPKKFEYTTEILPVKNEWLEDSGCLASKSFHFLEGPVELEDRAETLSACLKAVGAVDVFSPNHLELFKLFGKEPQTVLNKSEIETLAEKFLDSGVGAEGAGILIVRAAEYGSMIISRNTAPIWIPPYYGPGPEAQSVVDATGSGNAFLGAYAVGFLKTHDSVKAACYGSVGASFALEQVGIPKKSNDGAEELWNGVTVAARLQEYLSRVGIPKAV